MEDAKQLTMDFEDGSVKDYIPEEKSVVSRKCKHNVRIKSYKCEFVSYCTKCGKILSVKNKKIKEEKK